MKCPHCGGNIDVQFIKAPANAKPAKAKSEPGSVTELEELLEAIVDETLEGKNADFVADMREKFGKYKGRTMVSEKQLAWLRSIANPEESF